MPQYSAINMFKRLYPYSNDISVSIGSGGQYNTIILNYKNRIRIDWIATLYLMKQVL